MKHGLSGETLAELRRILVRHLAVEKAILYGSRAKGTYQNGSDIDLALVGGSLDSQIMSRISEELEDSWLPYRVDLSLLSEIRHTALLEHIQRAGFPLYDQGSVGLLSK